jgi:hypothetical protein
VSIVIYDAKGWQRYGKPRLATKQKNAFQAKAGILCLLAHEQRMTALTLSATFISTAMHRHYDRAYYLEIV